MNYLWHTFLYDPLLNLLIGLYNGPANRSLGLALIELTVLVRIFLLPLTILSLRANARFARLRRKVFRLEELHRKDSVRRKEAIRKLIKKYHINPWARASALGIQFLILIILYWVFIDAIRDYNFTGLYFWNSAPDYLDSTFYTLNLVERSPLLPAVIGFLLYVELHLEQRHHRETLTNRDVVFRLLFPLSVFVLLYLLPAGKSIFVLTSILFTVILEGVYRIFVRRKPKEGEIEEDLDGGELLD